MFDSPMVAMASPPVTMSTMRRSVKLGFSRPTQNEKSRISTSEKCRSSSKRLASTKRNDMLAMPMLSAIRQPLSHM